MTMFVPLGCRTCHDVLREMYEEKHGTLGRVGPYGWVSLFASKDPYRRAELKLVKRERLEAIVFDLQGQLYAGEKTACWAGKAGLTDLSGNEFSDERGSVMISMGLVHPAGWAPDSGSKELLIRAPVAVKPVKVANAKGGAARKIDDAQTAYNKLFPEGHKLKEHSAKGALRILNAELEARGLERIGISSFYKIIPK